MGELTIFLQFHLFYAMAALLAAAICWTYIKDVWTKRKRDEIQSDAASRYRLRELNKARQK